MQLGLVMAGREIGVDLPQGWKGFITGNWLEIDKMLPEGWSSFITLSCLHIGIELPKGWKGLHGVAWAASLVYL